MKGMKINLKQYIEDCEYNDNEDHNKFGSYLRKMNAYEEEEQLREENPEDVVTMDIPFLTRLLELSREDIKDDDMLHRMLKKIIQASTDGHTLTMADYDEVASGIDGEEDSYSEDEYSNGDDIPPASGEYSESPMG